MKSNGDTTRTEIDLQELKDSAYRTGDVQLAAQIAQLCDQYAELKTEIRELRKELEDQNISLLTEIARDRQRITALEAVLKAKEAEKNAEERLRKKGVAGGKETSALNAARGRD